MARVVPNNKGFLIIAMTPIEASDICGFGFNIGFPHRIIVDDNTNETINNHSYIYYVSVLNRVFSKTTLKHWLESAKRYEEDIPFEQRHFNHYKKLLNL